MRHVGRLLDGNVGSRPAELVKDDDLVLLKDRILEMRGRDTVVIGARRNFAGVCGRWYPVIAFLLLSPGLWCRYLGAQEGS